MTHSNANEGRTQKDARQALKLWELQTGGSSSLKEGNAYMDGYNDGWDARERRSEEDAAADAPAPAPASQGDAPPESTPEQYAADYASLHEMPSDVLASRIVGQLILQKGNLNKYKAVLQRFIENYRRDSLRSGRGGLTFQAFAEFNRKRCEAPNGFNHQLASWSTSDWFVAILGELGEAANVAKKLNRVRDGVRGNKETEHQLHDKLRQELGDTQVYLDLIAQSLGFNIGDAAMEVFESKSKEIGYVAVPPQPSASAEPSEPQAGQIAAEWDGRGFPRNLQKEFEQRVEAAAKRAAPTGQEREESDVHDLAVRLAGWLGYGGYIIDHFEKTINEWLAGRAALRASGKGKS